MILTLYKALEIILKNEIKKRDLGWFLGLLFNPKVRYKYHLI
jgi:hypothetical protein